MTLKVKCVRTAIFWSCLTSLVVAGRTVNAATCSGLQALTLSNATIISAETFPAKTWSSPRRPRASVSFPVCLVDGVMTPSPTSRIRFEVMMPISGWNGRFVQVGNGAFAGDIYTSTLAAKVAEGYAAAGTDDGSESNGTWSWLRDPDRLADFGYRAVHLTALNAKIVVQAYYGAAPLHAYFEGQSKGGQEALMETQRFPDDFDGIIAMFPGFYVTHLMAALIWNSEHISALPADKLKLVHQAVMRTCLPSAGISGDDFLTTPTSCSFDPAILQCRGSDQSPSCLTAEEVAAVHDLYRGALDPKTGAPVYGGEVRGSETTAQDIRGPYGWEMFEFLAEEFAQPFLSNAVFSDPKWNWKSFDFSTGVSLIDSKVGKYVNAIDPNLESFRRHGGKLIMTQGWNDPLTPPFEAINYYNKVVAERELQLHISNRLDALKNTQTFFRLFMVPGEGHGVGVGPMPKDPLKALVRWVESGTAPDTLAAEKTIHDSGKDVVVRRPLCSYPAVAEWRGPGASNDPNNFVCEPR